MELARYGGELGGACEGEWRGRCICYELCDLVDRLESDGNSQDPVGSMLGRQHNRKDVQGDSLEVSLREARSSKRTWSLCEREMVARLALSTAPPSPRRPSVAHSFYFNSIHSTERVIHKLLAFHIIPANLGQNLRSSHLLRTGMAPRNPTANVEPDFEGEEWSATREAFVGLIVFA